MNTVNHNLPDVLQASDGTVNEKSLLTNNFAVGQKINHYGTELAPTVGKPRSANSYDRVEVLFSQLNIDGLVQKNGIIT